MDNRHPAIDRQALTLCFQWLSEREDKNNVKLTCKLFREVYKLGVNRLTFNVSIEDSQLESLLKHYSNLTHLSLPKGTPTDSGLWSVASNCQNLAHFSLVGNQKIKNRGAVIFANNCSKLRELSLTQCNLLSDPALEGIANSDLMLESLDLTNCSGVSVQGLVTFLKAKEKGLRSLNLSNCKGIAWSDVNAEQLPRCSQLSQFILQNSECLTNEALALLFKQFFAQGILTYLDLSNAWQVDDALIMLNTQEKSLTHLVLDGCSTISDLTLRRVVQCLLNLKVFSIGKNDHLTSKTLHILVKRCPNLSRISLKGCPQITGYPLIQLLDNLPSKCQLDMDGVTIDQSNVSRRAFSGFQKLDLSGYNEVTDQDLELIASSIDELSEINLSGCKCVSDKGLIPLLEKAPRLQTLNLSGTAITEKSLTKFQPNNLHTLDLSRCAYLEDRAIRWVANIPSLANLYLDEVPPIEDEIFALLGNKKLATLSLKGTSLSARAIQGIAFRSPNLSTLVLGPQVTDQTFQGLTLCTQFLQKLVVFGNPNLSEKALLAIANGRPTLSHLEFIEFSAITDDGLTSLLKVCPKLEYLNLENCPQITEKTLAAIAEYNPELTTLKLSNVLKLEGKLERLLGLKNLHTLSLLSCGPIASPQKLAAALPLENLQISHAKISFEDLKAFNMNINITTLSFHHCQIVDNAKVATIFGSQLLFKDLAFYKCRGNSKFFRHTTPRNLTIAHCPSEWLKDVRSAVTCNLSTLHLESSVLDKEDLRNLSNAPYLDTLSLGLDNVSPNDIFIVLRRCSGLTSFLLKGREQLKGGSLSLDLPQSNWETIAFPSLPEELSDSDIKALLPMFRSAKEIVLRRSPKLTDESLFAIAGIGRSIQKITLDRCPQITSRGIAAILTQCPLVELSFVKLPQINYPGLEQLKLPYKSLKKLTFEKCNSLSDQPLAELLDTLPQLRALSLVSCQGVTNTTLNAINRLKNLESLNLSNSPGFSSKALSRLVLPNLRTLNLSHHHTQVDNSVLEKLAKNIPNLQELDISSTCSINKIPFKNLKSLICQRYTPDSPMIPILFIDEVCSLSQLENIDLSYSMSINSFVDKLSKSCPNLKTMILRGGRFSGNMFNKASTPFDHLKKLERLDLTDSQTSFSFAFGISKMAQMRNIEIHHGLKIDPAYYGNVAMLDQRTLILSDGELLQNLLNENRHLTTLQLTDCQIDTECLSNLANTTLSSNALLTTLNLSNSKLTFDGMTTLCSVLENHPSIVNLNFQGCGLGDQGAKALCSMLQKRSSIISLNVGWNDISPEVGVALLSALSKQTCLEILNLGTITINKTSMKELATVLECNRSLHSLEMRGCDIDDENIAALQKTTSIENLDLAYNSIGTEGAKALILGLKKNPQLKRLDLTSNTIGDDGTTLICSQLAGNKHLTHLFLSRNGIGAIGAEQIGSFLEFNSSLTYLQLTHNNVGYNGALAIADGLKKNHSVSSLSMEWNDVTEMGVEALKNAADKQNPHVTLLC